MLGIDFVCFLMFNVLVGFTIGAASYIIDIHS